MVLAALSSVLATETKSSVDISWFYNGLENFKTTVTCNMLFKTIGIVAIFMFVKDENDLVLYILITLLPIQQFFPSEI